jgi:tRNA threonylcarbamoyladenosine biosynthesis protein TsaB
MIVLAVDSSGREGSLALARAENSGLEIIALVSLDGGNFSAQLVPQIAALLAKHNFALRDIAGFAVAVGPGSFTGLRVGLAAVKGLAEALAKPIAAVSRLEAVARSSGREPTSSLLRGRRQVCR